MSCAPLHLLVVDTHRVALAGSSKHCDASLDIFLRHTPGAADVECAWWEFAQAVKATADHTAQDRSRRRRAGISNSIDLLEAARNKALAAPVRRPPNIAVKDGGAALSQCLRAVPPVDAPRPTEPPVDKGASSAPDASAGGQSGTAGSRQALATIEATLAKYRADRAAAAAAAAGAGESGLEEVGGAAGPSSAFHDSPTSAPPGDALGATRAPPHDGAMARADNPEGAHDALASVRPSQVWSSREMSGVITESRPLQPHGRSAEARDGAGDAGSSGELDGAAPGRRYFYDEYTRTLEVLDAAISGAPGGRPEPREPNEPTAAHEAITVDRHSATSPGLLDQLRERLARSADTPHPHDLADAARRERLDVEIDEADERLSALEARAPRSQRMRAALQSLRRRVCHAQSLRTIHRHEQDTLRMAHCAALLERKLYASMLERVRAAMQNSYERLDCLAASHTDATGDPTYAAESQLLDAVERALSLAQEDME